MAIICQMFVYENLPFNEDIDILVPSGWHLCASSSSKLKTTFVVQCRKWMAHMAFILHPSFGVRLSIDSLGLHYWYVSTLLLILL